MSQEAGTISLTGLLRIVIHGVLPLLLFLTAVRLAMTDAYVQLSYRMPGFPPDSYGFSRQERLEHSAVALDYLLNEKGIDFLGERTFADGAPLYNARELRHMEDVKRLTGLVIGVWRASVALVLLGALGLLLLDEQRLLGAGLRGGARLTLGLMLGLGVALLISFPFVFVGFHRIFFEGNSWLFRYSDTLIRLFPERFWQQVFVFLTIVTAAEAGLLWAVGRRLVRGEGEGRSPEG